MDEASDTLLSHSPALPECYATNNNLMEKPASCPAVFHVFAQTLYSSLSPPLLGKSGAVSPVLQTALLAHQV